MRGVVFFFAIAALGAAGCTGVLGDFRVGPEAGPPPGVVTEALKDVSFAAAGERHTCARVTNGDVYCWGFNARGQIGVAPSTKPFSARPVKVAGIANAKAIASGANHTCGIDSSGTVFCWGRNDQGQLGLGKTDEDPHPTAERVQGDSGVLSNAIAIAAGECNTCAVLQGGAVACWGCNGAGQLGIPAVALTTKATKVPKAADIDGIAAGQGHVCAIAKGAQGAKPVCWGRETAGQLGDNKAQSVSFDPVDVQPSSGLKLDPPALVAAGLDHSCAIDKGNRLVCWGSNAMGQLGKGTDVGENKMALQAVSVATDVSQVGAGGQFTCYLTKAGDVLCSGANDKGQLGDGKAGENGKPSPGSHADTVKNDNLKGVIQITAGRDHACAVKKGAAADSGTLLCWGSNVDGQLGNNTLGPSSSPAEVVIAEK